MIKKIAIFISLGLFCCLAYVSGASAETVCLCNLAGGTSECYEGALDLATCRDLCAASSQTYGNFIPNKTCAEFGSAGTTPSGSGGAAIGGSSSGGASVGGSSSGGSSSGVSPRQINCIKSDGSVVKAYGTCPAGSVEGTILINPLGGSAEKPQGNTDVITLITKIINGAMGIMGAVVLLLFVWGSSGILLAAGNQEKIKSGTQTILWAAIGTLVVFFSYILLRGIMAVLFGGY